MVGRSLLLAALALCIGCRAGGGSAGGEPPAGWAPAIEVVLTGETGAQRVEVRGLQDVDEPEGGWADLFHVSVRSAHIGGGPAVLGRYEPGPGRLVFEPRYELEPDLEYMAVVRLAMLPNATGTEPDLVRSLVVPRREAPIEPTVLAVYPTARPLPANVLKFYLHFSRPMSRGFAYEQVHVLDDTGARVERPFLELGEELWNPDGTRLTLLLDPGRIKRGLLLHEEMGSILESGRSYALVILPGWPGADRARLEKETRIEFQAVETDLAKPNPETWRLEVPRTGSRGALVVSLDEPLDHALLQHMLQAVGADGLPLEGKATIDAGETRWTFVPAHPWKAGPHGLHVDANLEDLAGNSVGRLFETRLGAKAPISASAPVRIPFQPLPPGR